MLANADIFFTKSAYNLRQIFSLLDRSSLFLAISRYEAESEIGVLHSCPHYSQDVWAVHTDSLGKLENRVGISRVSMGSMRCDSRIAYLFKDQGFNVVNPCKFVHPVHLHKSNFRTYSHEFNYGNLGPSLFVFPSEEMGAQSLQQLVLFDKAPSQIIGVRAIQLC